MAGRWALYGFLVSGGIFVALGGYTLVSGDGATWSGVLNVLAGLTMVATGGVMLRDPERYGYRAN
jgi:hypothetical protein